MKGSSDFFESLPEEEGEERMMGKANGSSPKE
jgi:hypothetical protein